MYSASGRLDTDDVITRERSSGDSLLHDVTERKRFMLEREEAKDKKEHKAKNDKHKKKNKKKKKDKKKKDSDADDNSKSSSDSSSSSSSSSSSGSDSDSNDDDDKKKKKKEKKKKNKKEKDKKKEKGETKDKEKKTQRQTTMTVTTDLDGGSLRKNGSSTRGPSFNNDSGNDTSEKTKPNLMAYFQWVCATGIKFHNRSEEEKILRFQNVSIWTHITRRILT